MGGYKLEVLNGNKIFKKSGKEFIALQDTTIQIEEGKFISIIGPSGCGKSTLFNMIAGLMKPTSGEILLDGKSIVGENGHVGYMLQKDLLLPWRTILENVILGLEIKGTPKKEAHAKALPLLHRYGLKGFENHLPNELSGGMRQRAALLRTILYDSEIILLDEPFGALDAQTRLTMQNWLYKLVGWLTEDESKGLNYIKGNVQNTIVDTYTVIIDNQKRTPVLDDFSQTPQKIVDRFLYYLELHEKETLKVLSFARYWTEELFVELVSEFKTGYPIFAYKDLFRFSFINQYENRTWDMNLMMRNSLQEEIKKENPYLYKKAHQFLYKYYNEKITNKENGQVSREDWPYFREAFYHGNIIMETDDFLNWFLTIGKELQNCGQFELISSYYNELIEQIAYKDNEQAAAIYQYFGGIGLLQGNYELAQELLQKAAAIYTKLPTKKREYLKCCNDLAEIMIHMTNFDQAYDYFSKAIESYQNTNSEELEELLELALVYIRLGKLDIRFSKYENSTEHYKTAISLCNQVLEISPESAVAYGRLALSYEKLGELHSTFNSNEKRQYYLQSIEHYKNAIEREYDVRTLANMGLAYKRLGESYELKTETIDKLKSYEEAISIFNEVVEKAPDFIDVLEKKGHALVDYLTITIELEQYNRARECFNEAVETFETVLELSPKQVGSQNRIGSAHRELAKMYMKKNEPTLAISHLQKALEIYDGLKSMSNYIYVDNSMGKTYELLGNFHREHNDTTRAAEHYKLAINSFQAMLKRAPKLQEAIVGIERIRKLLDSLAD